MVGRSVSRGCHLQILIYWICCFIRYITMMGTPHGLPVFLQLPTPALIAFWVLLIIPYMHPKRVTNAVMKLADLLRQSEWTDHRPSHCIPNGLRSYIVLLAKHAHKNRQLRLQDYPLFRLGQQRHIILVSQGLSRSEPICLN